MLKQDLKTIKAEFIQTHALSQFCFGQFRPYAILFLGLVFLLTLMSKSNKTQEMSLDLTPSFKTSVDARVKGLVSNVDYLENWHCNFIQKKCGRKRCLPCTHVSFSGLKLLFLYALFTPLMAPKGKKRINKTLSMLSKQSYYFFYFWIKGLSFKTQMVNGKWGSVNAWINLCSDHVTVWRKKTL